MTKSYKTYILILLFNYRYFNMQYDFRRNKQIYHGVAREWI